ncbi:MAG TPA: hypothetical protein VH459_06020 [Gaiellales bacterium]
MKLVAAPDGCRQLSCAVQNATRNPRIAGQPERAVDGLADVRNHAVTPAPHLVAEDPRPGRPAGAHRAFDDDAALGPPSVRHRSLLDHEPSFAGEVDDKRGVVEVACLAVCEPRRDGLEDAPVQPHRHASGAQRQPVEVDGGRRRARGVFPSHASIMAGRIAHGIGRWTECERAGKPHTACARPPMCERPDSRIVDGGNDHRLVR